MDVGKSNGFAKQVGMFGHALRRRRGIQVSVERAGKRHLHAGNEREHYICPAAMPGIAVVLLCGHAVPLLRLHLRASSRLWYSAASIGAGTSTRRRSHRNESSERSGMRQRPPPIRYAPLSFPAAHMSRMVPGVSESARAAASVSRSRVIPPPRLCGQVPIRFGASQQISRKPRMSIITFLVSFPALSPSAPHPTLRSRTSDTVTGVRRGEASMCGRNEHR